MDITLNMYLSAGENGIYNVRTPVYEGICSIRAECGDGICSIGTPRYDGICSIRTEGGDFIYALLRWWRMDTSSSQDASW